ncbi:MAG TPA: protein kinase [Thermoanaerobaculia bacterium]|nr:protein kinase [Thermoanaerobaculia bacterium]
MPFHCLRCKAEIESTYRACPHCGEAITDFTRRYTSELLDGKYQIVERLGAGGMGQVYKAVHTYLGATRVIKVVHPHISESKDAHDRFLREARAATKIQHTNVAGMHDFSELPDGSHYMVSEYVDGENLAQRLRARGTLHPRQAVRIAIQALHGLEAIHRAGIVHRDISPENLMITADETVKVIDLGVAKVDDTSQTMETQTGIFVGKLRYASPEQLGFLPDGEKIDGRADLYALGMVLFELLTGRPPYEATSPHEYFRLHARQPETPNIELPAEMPARDALQNALNRALARDRNQRFSSAREFASALEEIDRSLPDQRAMPTVATPLDGDATMRQTPPVDTLHRETVRTGASPTPSQVQATVRTNVPGAPAPPTVLTPMPAPMPSAAAAGTPAPRRSKGINPLVVVGVFLVLFGIAAAAGVLLWPRVKTMLDRPQEVAQTETVTTTTAAPEPQSKVAEASVSVVTTTSEPAPVPVPTATIIERIPATTTTQAPSPITTTTATPLLTETIAPPPPKKRIVAPEPAPVREEPVYQPAPSNLLTYIDGNDDGSNDDALERLRQQTRGVRQIEVHGGAMNDQLAEAIKDQLPHVRIMSSAPIEIRFEGKLEFTGRGRKTREARATVYKNGRPIFRYELPTEVYRVGLPPAHAFARVLSDAFEEE